MFEIYLLFYWQSRWALILNYAFILFLLFSNIYLVTSILTYLIQSFFVILTYVHFHTLHYIYIISIYLRHYCISKFGSLSVLIVRTNILMIHRQAGCAHHYMCTYNYLLHQNFFLYSHVLTEVIFSLSNTPPRLRSHSCIHRHRNVLWHDARTV